MRVLTHGMILAARALLDANPDADEAEVRRGLSGNLCRCTGYDKIVKAVWPQRDRAMRLDQEFTVAAPADRVWTFLMDVPRLATCIPGASDVRQIEDRSYDATGVKTKMIGPIAASFGCKNRHRRAGPTPHTPELSR